MKRIILFLTVGLLMFINSFAGNKEKNTLAAVAGFTASVTTGCAPLSVQFNSTSTSDVGDPVVNYTWDFGDGTIINTTDPNPQHTFNTQGNFTVVLTVTTQGGATDTRTEVSYIQTFDKLIPDLGPDTTLCAASLGVGYLLQANVPGGYSYTWDDPFENGNPSRYVTSSGTYWVEVGNGTCSVRDSVTVVVTASFKANFSYTVLNDCGSMQVQFNNLTTQCGSGTLDYSWYMNDPGGGAFWEENPIYTFTDPGTYNVELNIYDPNSGESDGIVIPITVAFSSGPTAPNLGGDRTICAGNSVQLDAGDEAGVTYSWSPATGLSDASIYNPVATPATTTSYTVTKSKCGVDEAATINITVNPALSVNLGPDQQTCGGIIIFNTGVTGATSTVWGGTVGSFGVGFTNSQTAPTNVPGTYWVTVVKDGCEARDTVVVTSLPPVHAEFSAAQTGSCSTYSVQFTDMSVINCGSLDYYTWDFGDGTVVTYNPPTTAQKNPSHTYAATGTYTATLIVMSNSAKSDTFSVVVNVTGSGPSVDLGADRTICNGSSTTLDAGNAGATYSWSTGETTQTINVNTSGTYFVTVTNGACSDRDTIDIHVNSAPVAVNLGPNRAICTGTTTVLDAGNVGSTYLWSTGETTQTITVGIADTYSVTVTDGSCTGGDTVVITVTGVPVSVNLGADRSICTGGSTTLDAGNAGSTYLWSTGETTQTISVYTAGTYSVQVNNGACSDDDDINVTVNTAALSVNLGADTTLCSGGTLALNAGNAGSTYLWSTGETTQSIAAATTNAYWVEVSNGGCTARDTINVTINPTPLVVNLGPDGQIACGIFAINSGVTGASSIIWESNPVIPALAGYNLTPTPSIAVMDPATYWVTVVKDGCTARDTIVVGAIPQVNANFVYNQQTFCPPYSVKFTSDVHTTFACGTRRNFTWDFGDGTVVSYVHPAGSLQRNPVHEYTGTGPYNVTLIVTNSNNKADTITIPITVTGSGIDVNLGNDTTICAGSTLTLDAGSHPGATYTWSTGENSQTIQVTTSGNYSVLVSNGVCSDPDNIVVTVAPDLTVNLGNDTTICTGNTVVLDAGHPGASYLWSTGETTQTIQPSLVTGINTRTVAVTLGACSGNGDIDINVIENIPVSLGNDTTICAGSSLTLNADYPGATYLWSTGGVTQTINVITAGSYSVNVNHNGCTGSDEIEVAIVNAPSPVNLGNDTTICSSAALVLDAGNPGASYLWSTGATTQTITAFSSGTYRVTVSTGCGTDVYDEIIVIMGSAPMPVISQQGNELVSTVADTYQWYKGGVVIPGATDRKYKPRGYGTYSVRVTTGSSGCVGEAIYFFVPAGDIYIGDIRVKVTPNPGNGLAKLILSKLPSKPIKVTVYDRVGRRVLINTIVNTVNDLNLTKFAKGEYFVELVADDKRVVIPVITQ